MYQEDANSRGEGGGQPGRPVGHLAEWKAAQSDGGIVARWLGEEWFAVQDGVKPVPAEAFGADDGA